MSDKIGPVVGVGGVIVVGGSVPDAAAAPRVCLIRRGQPPMKGSWSLPGGRVEHGETLEQAVKRELLEETGYRVTVGPLIEVVELMGRKRHYVVHDYLCWPDGDEQDAPRAGSDADDARLLSVEEMAGYQLTDAVIRVVRKALALAATS